MRFALSHLRHAQSGGTERTLDRLAGFLAERGHEVTILCRSHGRAPHPSVRFQPLRGFALGGAWRMWGFARAVERYLGDAEFDLVVGLGRTWTQDVLRLGGGCQRTYLELAHDATLSARDRLLGGGAWKHALAVRIEERALASAALVITNSHMVRRDVQARYGIPEERLSTVHNGVDLERFHPRHRAGPGAAKRHELGIGEDECLVLFLGTGYARKGLDLVLDAFPRLLGERPAARLVVAGFDSAQARYQARAAALGIAPRTVFVGGTLTPEHLYSAADLYVLPTRYDPFANSTLEALAAGVPVITSTTNGAGELLTPRVDGARIDVQAGAEAVVEELLYWSDPERLRAGKLAARRCAEQHGEGATFEVLLRLFARIVEQRAAGVGARP